MTKTKGFTLIELLVVISILALLSAIITASLKNARLSGRDALIKSQMIQMRNLLLLEYDTNLSYANLQPGVWITAATGGTGDTCDTRYPTGSSNANVVRANEICKIIFTNSEDGGSYGRFIVGTNSSQITTFSMMAYLPGENKWLCIGQSGQSKMTTPTNLDTGWQALGCRSNP